MLTARSFAGCAGSSVLAPVCRRRETTLGDGSATSGAGRSWGETFEFATRANACADQPPTSAPSRAGTSKWRAAGLLRRQRCGPVRAADALAATEPLAAAAGRAPRSSRGTPRGSRCIATQHCEPPWTAVPTASRLRSASGASAGAFRTTNHRFSSFSVSFPPLLSEALD